MEAVSQSNLANSREENFTILYKAAFPPIAKYISRMGGSFEEAKDVFQDALIVFYENKILTSKNLSNDIGYLVGISKNLWLKRYRDFTQLKVLFDAASLAVNSEPQLNLSNNRLFRFLEIAGKKCMELLKAFYYDQIPLTEIADEFGYSGIRSATAQKYKCLEKVRDKVKQKALTYDDFME